MRKSFISLSTLIVSGVLAVTAISNAISLYTKGANNVAIKIGEAPTSYYLIGSFNGWKQNDTNYTLVDVTSSMAAEPNKIKEYLIEDLAFDSNVAFKIIDSKNNWYGSSELYSHCWSNDVNVSNDGNYLTPMRSSYYSIYLKFFSDNSYKIYISARKNILRFESGSTDYPDWLKDNSIPRITIKNSNSGDAKNNPGDIYVTGTKVATNKYDFTLTKDQYDKIINDNYYYAYQRLNSTGSEVWNYSSWMKIGNSDTNNAFWLSWRGSNWDNWGASDGDWWTI